MDELMEKAVEEEIKWFECSMCKMKESYDAKEEKPKFLNNITFNKDCYVVKDPFTPLEKKQFFILGSDCYICKNPVCQAVECSIYYKERYCQGCAWKNKKIFPERLQSKIKEPNS